MNPLALYFASGESLYPGSLLLLLAIALSPFAKSKWPLRLRNALASLAAALILLASAPFSYLLYTLLAIAFLLWFTTWNLQQKPTRKILPRLRPLSALLLSILLITLTALELPHRFLPTIPTANRATLVVLGDSISAGIDTSHPPWPAVFQSITHIPTLNLSRPGIGVEQALPLAKKIPADSALILLELGGNDMLFDLPAADFQKQLDQLLTLLDRPNRTILMFELPLFPHKIPFGQIQRKLAAQHHVLLIPKRFLINIIQSADATSDGLHLSQSGAQQMAAFIQSLLKNILAPAPSPTPSTAPEP